jgi:MFS family permease
MRGGDRPWRSLCDWRLLAFAGCAALFHLANAAMLPIAAAAVTKRAGGGASLIIAACIVGPQIVTAVLSPWVGRVAESWGRRPILLLGFSAVPIRGLLLALVADPRLIIPIQLFDGLGAAVFGVLFPLIVADVTRDTGTLHDLPRGCWAGHRRRRDVEHDGSRPGCGLPRRRHGLSEPRRRRDVRDCSRLGRHAGN